MSARATAIIPARLGSTRFPRKALADETGKALVVHVCERAALAESVGRVVVACDAEEIASVVRAAGFEAVMTSPEHENGTSRLAEAAALLGLGEREVIVNVQGDEPEIEPSLIDSAVRALRWRHEPGSGLPTARRVGPDGSIRSEVWASTVASPFQLGEDPGDQNIVKAVVGLLEADEGIGMALYFSRSRVPHPAEAHPRATPLKHVGLYAYQRRRLDHYVSLAPTPLEQTERLEQLRWLEHGLPVAVAVRHADHHGVDTPEQYAAFVERWRAANA
ncbi:MAG: manno-octulosonate cytidylyltransferase [Phycisphaerales bacterium]